MTCGIYKITNKINGKVYIGQSINIENRWKEHKSRYLDLNNKKPLYNAIRKYGIENFEFSIIEVCVSEELNDKEIYWIKYYNSIDKEKGYNLSLGPQPNYFRKLNDIEYNNLCKDLRDNILSIDEIAEKYNITFGYVYEINRGEDRRNLDKPRDYFSLRPKLNQSFIDDKIIYNIKEDLILGIPLNEIENKYKISKAFISNINHGRRHNKKGEVYPLHDYTVDQLLSENQINEIINLISKTNMSFKEIGKIYNRGDGCISDINYGKIYHKENIKYPIRNNKRKFLTEEEILEIYNLLLNSSLTYEEIRKKFKIGKITLYYINTGYTHKHEGYEYPLRK